jgi:predicted nucleic acid-binding protein
VTVHYVLDTGALIALERGKVRVTRFMQLSHAGVARLSVPLPVIAEWWRGRTDQREEILAATEVIASVSIAKAAGIALSKLANVNAALTIDAFVMASAALLGAVVITQDPEEFELFTRHFPKVQILPI